MEKTRRIYLDAEFHQRVIRGLPVVELISIGMVDEAGKTFYAISNEFNLNAAKHNEWLRDNVLVHLPAKKEWQSRKQIRDGIFSYIGEDTVQMAYWIIPHDVLLFEQLVSDNVMRYPENIRRVAVNLAQTWDELDRPDILPEFSQTARHNALVDAQWLYRVDMALQGYVRTAKPVI